MTKTQIKPIPDGMHTVTPHLICAGAADGSPVTIHPYVENFDAFFARAVSAGAKVTMPLEDTF